MVCSGTGRLRIVTTVPLWGVSLKSEKPGYFCSVPFWGGGSDLGVSIPPPTHPFSPFNRASIMTMQLTFDPLSPLPIERYTSSSVTLYLLPLQPAVKCEPSVL